MLNVCSQVQRWVLPLQTVFIAKKLYNLRTRELSVGEKQAVLKLIEGGKSIRAIELPVRTTTWKKETTVVLSNRCPTGRQRKTSAIVDRNIVRAVKKTPITTVSDITNNLQKAGVKVSQSTICRRVRDKRKEATPEDAN